MTLWFDVVNSQSLSPEDKELMMSRLGNRIGKDGCLRVICQQTRSQAENLELAMERFVELLWDALKQVPIRKKTRVSKGAKLRRLEEKNQRGIKNKRGQKKSLSRIRQKETSPGRVTGLGVRYLRQSRRYLKMWAAQSGCGYLFASAAIHK